MRKIIKNYSPLFSVFLLFCFGCGTLFQVDHSYISPKVKNISSWLIKAEEMPDSNIASNSITLLKKDITSTYLINENKRIFCDQIALKLKSKGYNVIDTTGSCGIISIKIVGRKQLYNSVDIGSGDFQFPSKGSKNGKVPYKKLTSISNKNNVLVSSSPEENDKVIGVELSFFDSNGNLLGIAQIKGENISPNEVARVIHRIFLKGNYNDFIGLPNASIFMD